MVFPQPWRSVSVDKSEDVPEFFYLHDRGSFVCDHVYEGA